MNEIKKVTKLLGMKMMKDGDVILNLLKASVIGLLFHLVIVILLEIGDVIIQVNVDMIIPMNVAEAIHVNAVVRKFMRNAGMTSQKNEGFADLAHLSKNE